MSEAPARPKYEKGVLDVDVVTEAKNRIRRCYEEFDHVSVSFSGGKDSLAMLWLAREVTQELGIPKVNVLFLDEEVIHQDVIDFVAGYHDQPWVDLTWFAIPLRSHKRILSTISDYIQWDPARDPAVGGQGYIRSKPPFATTQDDLVDHFAAAGIAPGEVISQHEAADVYNALRKGRCIQLLGVRTSESMMRWRAIYSRADRGRDCWMMGLAATGNRIYTGKPIFDWMENDVFRYFYDHGIPYCKIYDQQMWAGLQYRVGTALTLEGSRRLPQLRSSDPQLYDDIQRLFPEMTVHERYQFDFDELLGLREAGDLGSITYEDIDGWIDEHLEGQWERKARAMLRRAEREPHRYPPDEVMMDVIGGVYKGGYIFKKTQIEEAERAGRTD